MGYQKLTFLMFVSAVIPLVCGICETHKTKEEFLNSVKGTESRALVLNEAFTIKLDENQCTKTEGQYNHAFAKYIYWSEREVVDDKATHYGCTCQEVISLFTFAENTNPNHIMCRLTDIYATFCNGFPRDNDYNGRVNRLQEKLNALHSDFLEFVLHSATDILRQYMAKRNLDDAKWPLAKTLDDIKAYKGTYETKINEIAAKGNKDADYKDTEGPQIADSHVSMIILIMARSMDLNFEPQIAKEIIGREDFNLLGFAIKVMVLESIAKDVSSKQYAQKYVSKIPSLLNLMSVVLLPLGVNVKPGSVDMPSEVHSFVVQFFKRAGEMQDKWEVATTQKALSGFCRMALRDLKIIYENKKKEAELEAAKPKGGEAHGMAAEGGADGRRGRREPRQEAAAGHQEHTEGADSAGKTTTTPTAEQTKLAAIRDSFNSFADKQAVDQYITDNQANMDETYVITTNEAFADDVTLTCSYS